MYAYLDNRNNIVAFSARQEEFVMDDLGWSNEANNQSAVVTNVRVADGECVRP